MKTYNLLVKDGGEIMNIREFSSQDTYKKEQPNFEEIKNSKQFKEIEKDYGDVVQDFINNYSNKSEPELIQDLLKLIAEKKRDGTFDIQKLRDMAEVLAPMLDEEQRAKMYNLLNFLD